MQGASDLVLACAIHQAGAMPSLQIDWKKDRTTKHDILNQQIQDFVKLTGSTHCVLQLEYTDLKDQQTLNIIKSYNISHIEIIGLIGKISNDRMQYEFDIVMSQPKYLEGFNQIRSHARVLTRIFTPSLGKGIDAYALKGADSAGWSGNLSVKDLFLQQKLQTPDIPLIPYGGIGTPEQVAWYIKNGAAGVAVGTLFAATQESCLSEKTKTAMVQSSKQDLQKLHSTQRALVFGDISQDTEPNYVSSLNQGIAGLGGLLYAGSAIDHVTHIRTVQQVVDYLTSEL